MSERKFFKCEASFFSSWMNEIFFVAVKVFLMEDEWTRFLEKIDDNLKVENVSMVAEPSFTSTRS